MTLPSPAFISAVICTRDRPADVPRSAASILANNYPCFELLVIDQSRDGATEQALAPLSPDPRLRLIRSRQTGLSRARNLAASQARGAILAFTDDDCEAQPDWLSQLAQAFDRAQDIHLVFGRVDAAANAQLDGHTTSYRPEQPRLLRRLSDRLGNDGIGACMAVRSTTVQALHGFDEALGAGAVLRAAEDNDFALRALANNYFIYETPVVRVVHHGMRSGTAQDQLVHDYMFGTGAMFAKHLRLRSRGILRLLSMVSLRWAFRQPLVAYSRAPKRLMRLRAFCAGLAAGWRAPLNRKTGLFECLDR